MIPVNAPLLGKEELSNITKCVRSGWISSKGSYIKKFEDEFAKFCGVRHGISVTNGTAALHLAIVSLGLGEGDEVIMPAFTMIATAYAVLYTGARPVFVDSEFNTWNMDTAKIKELITARTRAILPVHIYGHPVNMDEINRLAKKYNLFVIEDAAEAHGAEYKGKRCGSLGDIGCFSFYANKIITTGEGGMVVTNNKKLAEKCRSLKDLAHSPKQRFLHTDLAFNYRMTNMQAAIGLAQLKKINSFLAKKKRMAQLYSKNLSNIKGLRLPREEAWAKSVYWMYGVVIEDDFGIGAEELRKQLSAEGVETRAFFIPMHRQPVIRRLLPENKTKKFPVADYIAKRGFYLPSGLAITESQIIKVCRAFKKIKNNADR